jgi:hypothetical protein
MLTVQRAANLCLIQERLKSNKPTTTSNEIFLSDDHGAQRQQGCHYVLEPPINNHFPIY